MALNMAMVRVYANLVANGRRTLESIPEEYRQAVKEYME